MPVTVIGGYLGAGKTTLINAMLRQANGLRIAVLVNEFGALPIDEDLILAADDDVISIAGGCICCSFGDNLVGAFTDLLARTPRPDHIVIEASGVAIPASVASTLSLVAGVSLSGIVVLADAETIRARACDTFIGDTVLRQIAGADLVLVTKSDLVDEKTLVEIDTWMRHRVGGAEVISTRQGNVPNAIILGDLTRANQIHGVSREDHGALYQSIVLHQRGSVRADGILAALTDAALGLVRAKGFVRDHSGQILELQVVGVRGTARQADAPGPIGLVCIGVKSRFQQSDLVDCLAPFGFHPEVKSAFDFRSQGVATADLD